MLLQPVQPLSIIIKISEDEYVCQMLSLSEEKLELKSNEYFEKGCVVSFYSKYFRGLAVIKEITFSRSFFTYQMNIQEIQFQPGLLINTRL